MHLHFKCTSGFLSIKIFYHSLIIHFSENVAFKVIIVYLNSDVQIDFEDPQVKVLGLLSTIRGGEYSGTNKIISMEVLLLMTLLSTVYEVRGKVMNLPHPFPTSPPAQDPQVCRKPGRMGGRNRQEEDPVPSHYARTFLVILKIHTCT